MHPIGYDGSLDPAAGPHGFSFVSLQGEIILGPGVGYIDGHIKAGWIQADVLKRNPRNVAGYGGSGENSVACTS